MMTGRNDLDLSTLRLEDKMLSLLPRSCSSRAVSAQTERDDSTNP